MWLSPADAIGQTLYNRCTWRRILTAVVMVPVRIRAHLLAALLTFNSPSASSHHLLLVRDAQHRWVLIVLSCRDALSRQLLPAVFVKGFCVVTGVLKPEWAHTHPAEGRCHIHPAYRVNGARTFFTFGRSALAFPSFSSSYMLLRDRGRLLFTWNHLSYSPPSSLISSKFCLSPCRSLFPHRPVHCTCTHNGEDKDDTRWERQEGPAEWLRQRLERHQQHPGVQAACPLHDQQVPATMKYMNAVCSVPNLTYCLKLRLINYCVTQIHRDPSWCQFSWYAHSETFRRVYCPRYRGYWCDRRWGPTKGWHCLRLLAMLYLGMASSK